MTAPIGVWILATIGALVVAAWSALIGVPWLVRQWRQGQDSRTRQERALEQLAEILTDAQHALLDAVEVIDSNSGYLPTEYAFAPKPPPHDTVRARLCVYCGYLERIAEGVRHSISETRKRDRALESAAKLAKMKATAK